ncbi:MAG: DUF4139 domain-containing protein [Phycisphaeraceae bacterium]
MPTRPTRLITLALFAALFAAPALAQDGPAESLSLTIYSNADPHQFDPQRYIAQQHMGHNPQYAHDVPGFAVIRSRRTMAFDEGDNRLELTDVARFIDPTSVSFVDLDAPDATAVLEQQFEFDLASPDKLLERYIDRPVTLSVPAGDNARDEVTGRLISITGNQLVLQTDAGLRLIPYSDEVQVMLGALPEGLVTRPTLTWLVHSTQAGERAVRTSYQTDGLTWQADYNLILNADDTAADMAAWVTLLNLSGAAYENAQLKLIAGEVQRIEQQRPQPMRMEAMPRVAGPDFDAAGFEQQAFFEYHLYTLPRRTDVPDNATKQLALFPTAADVPVEKVLVFEPALQGNQPREQFGASAGSSVDVYIRFDNVEDDHLGMPLPRGRVRVFKENPGDASPEFVGEDLIDHTPRGEEVFVKVGRSFDVVAERTRTHQERDNARRTLVETYRVTARNQKQDEDETLIIRERLYRFPTAEVTDASHDHERVDAHTLHFELEVPAGEEREVTYTVRYTW